MRKWRKKQCTKVYKYYMKRLGKENFTTVQIGDKIIADFTLYNLYHQACIALIKPTIRKDRRSSNGRV